MKEVYRIKQEHSSKERLIHLFKGKRVNLSGGDIKCTIAATHKAPKKTITVKGASQEILKELLENPEEHGNWNYLIEKVEEPET